MVVLTSFLDSLGIPAVVACPLGKVLTGVLTWEPCVNAVAEDIEALKRGGLNALEKLHTDFRKRLCLGHLPLLNFFLESRVQQVEQEGNSGLIVLLVIVVVLLLLSFHRLGN